MTNSKRINLENVTPNKVKKLRKKTNAFEKSDRRNNKRVCRQLSF
jgi:hypothetical protein